MNNEGHERRVPDITLEQYLLGELPRRERDELARLLERDDEIRARLEELEQSNREIMEQYPVDLMSRKIQSKLGRNSSQVYLPRSWPMKAVVGAAAILLLVLFLPKEFDSLRPSGTTSTERTKGIGPQLNLYRKTPTGSEALEDGARVAPGDVIRIAYLAAGRSYGVIASVDGRGTVTLHVPHQGSQSEHLIDDGQILLDFALELDDAPRWERFYFVTGDTPFDVASVLEAAEQIDTTRSVDRAERLDVSKDLDQFVLTLAKEENP